MTMLGNRAAEVEDPEGEPPAVPGQRDAGGGLVLPEEVVAQLAAELAAQARAGGPVR